MPEFAITKGLVRWRPCHESTLRLLLNYMCQTNSWLRSLWSDWASESWCQYGSRECLEIHMGSRSQSTPV